MERLSIELDESSRDAFPDLDSYLVDLSRALGFRLQLQDDSENPLSDLASEVNSFRTGDRLENRWECGGVEVDYGSTDWSIAFEADSTFEVTFITSISETKKLLKQIIRKALHLKFRHGIDELLQEKLQQTLGPNSENYDPISEILSLLGPLIDRPNTRTWSEIEGFGDLWQEGRGPELRSELILNPDVQIAKDTISNWYRSIGCQICEQLTPSEPDGFEYLEKKVQIFKKKGTKYLWRTETLMEGVIGNLLYMCPNHHQLHQKHCLEIFLRVEGEAEPIELSKLVEMIERGETDIGKISKDGGLRQRTYERRARQSMWGEEDEELGASWSEPEPIRFGEGNDHEIQVIDHIIKYINFRLE